MRTIVVWLKGDYRHLLVHSGRPNVSVFSIYMNRVGALYCRIVSFY